MKVQQIDTVWQAGDERRARSRLARGKRPAGEIADTGRRLNHIAAEVTMLEERWLAVTSEIESLTAAG